MDHNSVAGEPVGSSALPPTLDAGSATPLTCAQCRHWQATDTFRETVPFGRCARIIHSTSICDDATDELRGTEYDWDKYEATETTALTQAKAFCVDGSGYHAALGLSANS